MGEVEVVEVVEVAVVVEVVEVEDSFVVIVKHSVGQP